MPCDVVEYNNSKVRSGVPRGAEGASRPGRHFRRGGTFGKNVKIYVKMVKFTLKMVTFSVKTDKRAEN